MTEKQFLQELESALTQMPQEERIDILQDIQEYFANGQADGKTDSEIAAELGAPEAIAKELIESFDGNQADFASALNDLAEDKFDKVDIQIENGILFISPSKDGKMHTDAINKSYRQQLSVDILNRTLVISLREERKWGIFSFAGSMKSPTLNVQLPAKIYEKIQIASDHGNVTGDGLQCTELLVETDNGRIHFSQLTADEAEFQSGNGEIELKSTLAKELRAETDNGQLKFQDVQARNLDAKSDNGAIVMKQVEGNIRAKTDNGRIHLLTNDLDRNIKLETDNGSIMLQTWTQPKNTTIRAEVDWGTVSVFGLKNRHSVFGNGDHSVDLQSDYGEITVQLAQ
ncbi:hypothetical protein QOZ98_000246 [Planomicrobium stackebrandtii]|uniref:DUF4097 domain-containing protein n=1 Tax=Planomicrobium stackebrandtii TaxID=253160 RepID=A0ABU0GPZ5_9BACL|nr:DUF4097 family beta strand repeat-containing protein [Planomicrobium stackebrandtii]MDQ0427421.1 hypothetical protein [Planomicrobium stackebrandtii]